MLEKHFLFKYKTHASGLSLPTPRDKEKYFSASMRPHEDPSQSSDL